MKTATIIYKHLNFKIADKGLAKLSKSLSHSLRIQPPENSTKKLEWDESRSSLNLVWIPGANKIQPLNAMTEDEKSALKNGIIESIKEEKTSKTHETETKDDLRKYKAKINKWFKEESDQSLKQFLGDSLEQKTAFNADEKIDQLSSFNFQRKNQKTNTFRRFLDLHNSALLSKSEISENKTFIQESFFKIPQHNNAPVPSHELINILKGFYRVNFPDYPIKLVVFHGDEHGDHPHIFTDGKNRTTGKYDLLKTQNEFVNSHIDIVKKYVPDAELLDFSKRSYFTKKKQAEYFQTLFYHHANQTLTPKYGVTAKKLDKTEANKNRMRLIEEDAKKPKIEREASFWNKTLIDAKAKNDTLFENNSKLDLEIDSKRNRIEELNRELEETESAFETFKKKANAFKESVFSYIKTFIGSLKEEEPIARQEVKKHYSGFKDDYEKLFADDFLAKTAENLSLGNAQKLNSIKRAKP